MHSTDSTKLGASVPNEKAPGAINTEGLTTDTTNDLNFATGTQQGKAAATLAAHVIPLWLFPCVTRSRVRGCLNPVYRKASHGPKPLSP